MTTLEQVTAARDGYVAALRRLADESGRAGELALRLGPSQFPEAPREWYGAYADVHSKLNVWKDEWAQYAHEQASDG